MRALVHAHAIKALNGDYVQPYPQAKRSVNTGATRSPLTIVRVSRFIGHDDTCPAWKHWGKKDPEVCCCNCHVRDSYQPITPKGTVVARVFAWFGFGHG